MGARRMTASRGAGPITPVTEYALSFISNKNKLLYWRQAQEPNTKVTRWKTAYYTCEVAANLFATANLITDKLVEWEIGFTCILESSWNRTGAWESFNLQSQTARYQQLFVYTVFQSVRFFASLIQDLLIIVMFCLNCPEITEIDIKYCCNTVHAVEFSRELVLENATLASLKVLEKSLSFSTKIYWELWSNLQLTKYT